MAIVIQGGKSVMWVSTTDSANVLSVCDTTGEQVYNRVFSSKKTKDTMHQVLVNN